jgi:hypothetical protein
MQIKKGAVIKFHDCEKHKESGDKKIYEMK